MKLLWATRLNMFNLTLASRNLVYVQPYVGIKKLDSVAYSNLKILLLSLLSYDRAPPIVSWEPPGTGKISLAKAKEKTFI